MATNETLTGPQVVGLPRKERGRARPEDLEMIRVAPAYLGEGRSTHETAKGGSR